MRYDDERGEVSLRGLLCYLSPGSVRTRAGGWRGPHFNRSCGVWTECRIWHRSCVFWGGWVPYSFRWLNSDILYIKDHWIVRWVDKKIFKYVPSIHGHAVLFPLKFVKGFETIFVQIKTLIFQYNIQGLEAKDHYMEFHNLNHWSWLWRMSYSSALFLFHVHWSLFW